MTDQPVPVPVARVERWFANFSSRHGEVAFHVADGSLHAVAADGSTAAACPPFGRLYDGAPDPAAYASTCEPPKLWAVLLVRKGGFAVARLSGTEYVESKVGQRHVQGKTKAGGQSQQRFARRRDNQARQAYEAAADHAARILTGPIAALVCGGDRSAVDAVLADTRLARVATRRVEPWLAVPDPRRSVLESAAREASSVRMSVVNAPTP